MRLTRPRLAAAAAAMLAAAGLAVAGCGGGETETVTTQSPPATAATTASTPTASTPTSSVPTEIPTATADTTADTTATGEETTSTTVDTSGTASIAQYLSDVQAASKALTAFGQALQNINSPQQLEGQVPSLNNQLDQFDAAIARLDGYTLAQAQLEAQRQRLVEAGPKLSDVLRRFLDAAQESIDTNNPAPVQEILPEVAQEIQAFVQAAQP